MLRVAPEQPDSSEQTTFVIPSMSSGARRFGPRSLGIQLESGLGAVALGEGDRDDGRRFVPRLQKRNQKVP